MNRSTAHLPVEEAFRIILETNAKTVCAYYNISMKTFAESLEPIDGKPWTISMLNKVFDKNKKENIPGIELTREKFEIILNEIRRRNEKEGHIYRQTLLDLGVRMAGQVSSQLVLFVVISTILLAVLKYL